MDARDSGHGEREQPDAGQDRDTQDCRAGSGMRRHDGGGKSGKRHEKQPFGWNVDVVDGAARVRLTAAALWSAA
jgi:hypothetical protein